MIPVLSVRLGYVGFCYLLSKFPQSESRGVSVGRRASALDHMADNGADDCPAASVSARICRA